MKILKLPVMLLEKLPPNIIKPIAFKYVAGETVEEVMDKARILKERKMTFTMDILGESAADPEIVDQYVRQYTELLKKIITSELHGGISVKPTALGLMISYDYCLEKMRAILDTARLKDIFVRIDMEDSSRTSDTIRLYKTLRSEYPRIGIVLQAYLRRTDADIELLAKESDVRICKGIYLESEKIAYHGKNLIRRNYLSLVKRMWEKNFFLGIATHDDWIIEEIMKLSKQSGRSKNSFEFQMLYGVRPHMAQKLIDSGYKVRIYLPFGPDWHAYSMRRMQENPLVALHVAKAVVSDPLVSFFNVLKKK